MTKGIIIKKSKINKKGVFAIRNFKKGEVVLKWNFKIVEESEIDKLDNSQKQYIYKAEKTNICLCNHQKNL